MAGLRKLEIAQRAEETREQFYDRVAIETELLWIVGVDVHSIGYERRLIHVWYTDQPSLRLSLEESHEPRG